MALPNARLIRETRSGSSDRPTGRRERCQTGSRPGRDVGRRSVGRNERRESDSEAAAAAAAAREKAANLE